MARPTDLEMLQRELARIKLTRQRVASAGGRARAARLTKRRRREIARAAGTARWAARTAETRDLGQVKDA